MLEHESGERRVPVHEAVVVEKVQVLLPVLEADELSLLLEEVVVLGHVLHQNVVGEVDGALHVRVIAPRHRAVDGRVRARDERAVALNVLSDVGRAVPEGLLVEDPEALVDRARLVLNLDMDGRELRMQFRPVLGVGRARPTQLVR